jgi:hypothetical protein
MLGALLSGSVILMGAGIYVAVTGDTGLVGLAGFGAGLLAVGCLGIALW